MSSAALLPPSASALERAAAEAFIQRADLPVRIGDLWNAHACPPEQLPWLAWALSVDEWFPEWTEQQRRHAIAASYEVHRHKGTPAAVKAALSVLGHPAQLIEWHQASPPGTPYTFRVEVTPLAQTGFVIDDALFARVRRLALSAKNTRSHLDKVRLVLAAPPVTVYTGACTVISQTITLYPPQPGTLDTNTPMNTGIAQMTHHTIHLYTEAP